MHYFLPFLWLKEGTCAQLWNSITKFFWWHPWYYLCPNSAANFGQVSSSAWVQKDSTEVRHILMDLGCREYKRSCIVTWLSGTEQRKCTSYVYQFHRVLLGYRIVKSSLPVSYFPASEHGEHSRWDKSYSAGGGGEGEGTVGACPELIMHSKCEVLVNWNGVTGLNLPKEAFLQGSLMKPFWAFSSKKWL